MLVLTTGEQADARFERVMHDYIGPHLEFIASMKLPVGDGASWTFVNKSRPECEYPKISCGLYTLLACVLAASGIDVGEELFCLDDRLVNDEPMRRKLAYATIHPDQALPIFHNA